MRYAFKNFVDGDLFMLADCSYHCLESFFSVNKTLDTVIYMIILFLC